MRRSPRRSSRPSEGGNKITPESDKQKTTKEIDEHHLEEEDEEEDDDHDDTEHVHIFQGVEYASYQEMVNAKRKRNQQVLLDSGLLDTVHLVQQSSRKSKQQQTQGLKKKKLKVSPDTSRRKSNRLAGIQSDGRYVDDERAGRFSIKSDTETLVTNVFGEVESVKEKEEYYRNRINDGSPISMEEAIRNTGDKWVNDDSVANGRQFATETLAPLVRLDAASHSRGGHQLTKKLEKQLQALQVDDADTCVAKVVPDRIYGIAAHPAVDKLIVCAGDKAGYVGIWNVDNHMDDAESDGVHLFRFHRGAASCLEWTPSGNGLFSASYDGTVRYFDVASESFEQIFATYDDQSDFRKELGYKMDTGHNYWTQYACLDHRFNNDKCFFLSTSVGTAMHIDLRIANEKGRLTFHESLSEKKINTLSLHPNGHSMISGGLDCHVKLWDLRKFRNNRDSSGSPLKPIASYNGGKSVNSAFFSPSGQYVVSTTMANKLDLFTDLHLSPGEGKSKKGTQLLKPSSSIRHDNMTGRWLSTFMAKWHPELDIFVVGSMRKPRCIEIFDGAKGDCTRAISGEGLTAVASRCCFHRSTDKLTVVGGNSSGRVTIAR